MGNTESYLHTASKSFPNAAWLHSLTIVILHQLTHKGNTRQQALARFGWYYSKELEGKVTEDFPLLQLQSCHRYGTPGCLKIGSFYISIQNTEALVWCEAATGWWLILALNTVHISYREMWMDKC